MIGKHRRYCGGTPSIVNDQPDRHGVGCAEGLDDQVLGLVAVRMVGERVDQDAANGGVVGCGLGADEHGTAFDSWAARRRSRVSPASVRPRRRAGKALLEDLIGDTPWALRLCLFTPPHPVVTIRRTT